MSFFKFQKQDVFHNRMKLHPDVHFYIKNEDIFYNKENHAIRSGKETIKQTPQGHLSLYEMNINREDGVGDSNLIYPYITKAGTLNSFSTISTENYQSYPYDGERISGSYPLSSTISIDLYLSSNTVRKRIKSLRNVYNYYTSLSREYAYKNAHRDMDTADIKLLSIPSIFYGSSIKKGSVKLSFFVSGSMVGTLEDIRQNGELVQTYPPVYDNENNILPQPTAGTIFYNEGFVSITGSWAITEENSHKDSFLPQPSPDPDFAIPDFPRWIYWGQRLSNPVTHDTASKVKDFIYSPPPPVGIEAAIPQSDSGSSWDISFKGTSYVSTMTMMAHAKKGELNYSNNQTFVKYEDRNTSIDPESAQANRYKEESNREFSNVVKSYYPNTSGSFEKITYISKIGIYDKDKNLIAIAKLATPVRKTEPRAYTFKMKMDF